MKKTLVLLLLCAACTPSVLGQNILRFKISRPYAVLNFMETSKGNQHTSKTLKRYIDSHIPKQDTAFAQLVQQFGALDLDMNFAREGFPTNRRPQRSTYDLICIAAVQANNLDEFKDRTVGILANSDHIQLFDILKKADIYFEKIIWKPHGEKAIKQMEAFERYQTQANQAFLKLKKLYKSDWGDDMPFTVAFVPIPKANGINHTSATPHANSLCVDLLTEENNYAGRMGVIMHEICHVLYDEQSRKTQHDLESYFEKSTSKYKQFANNFFDEGLATACGNGWSFQYLAGKLDTTAWYDSPYIDGFGHSLYPLVANYIEKGKSIDEAFIQEAIRLFGEKFPDTPNDFGIRLNKIALYTDMDMGKPQESTIVREALYAHFVVSGYNMSSPISDPMSIDMIKKDSETQVFLIESNEAENLKLLATQLPELKTIPYNIQEDFIINYIDSANRLIIIAKAPQQKFKAVFENLKQRKFYQSDVKYVKI